MSLARIEALSARAITSLAVFDTARGGWRLCLEGKLRRIQSKVMLFSQVRHNGYFLLNENNTVLGSIVLSNLFKAF